MRNLVLIFLLIGIYFSSCSDDDVNPFGFTGSATALKNSEQWNSGLRVIKNLPFNIGIDLNFTCLNQEGLQRESLGIFRVSPSLEIQKIYLSLSDNQIENDSLAIHYSTLIDDGDVVGDVYGIVMRHQVSSEREGSN